MALPSTATLPALVRAFKQTHDPALLPPLVGLVAFVINQLPSPTTMDHTQECAGAASDALKQLPTSSPLVDSLQTLLIEIEHADRFDDLARHLDLLAVVHGHLVLS